MKLAWGLLWEKSRKPLKTAWLITAGVVAIYIGGIGPMDAGRGIATERGTGLAAMSTGLPQSTRYSMGFIGGVPGTAMQSKVAAMNYVDRLPGSEDRKTIRTASLDAITKNPRDAGEQIRKLIEQAGGFVEKSEAYGEGISSSVSIVVRVPAGKFEEVRAAIQKLGLRVVSENLQAQDVTKQYVDEDAQLRNLRAQENQYLSILKSARTVKDTLDVSEKLDEVRGQIEQQQAEFTRLSKQVETVALSISLHAEADTQVFGIQWRPIYQLKLSARHGIESGGDYAASMASFLFYLPSILLWLMTILIGAAVGWRVLRWAGRLLFRARSMNAAIPESMPQK
jgi:hypothetical protein